MAHVLHHRARQCVTNRFGSPRKSCRSPWPRRRIEYNARCRSDSLLRPPATLSDTQHDKQWCDRLKYNPTFFSLKSNDHKTPLTTTCPWTGIITFITMLSFTYTIRKNTPMTKDNAALSSKIATVPPNTPFPPPSEEVFFTPRILNSLFTARRQNHILPRIVPVTSTSSVVESTQNMVPKRMPELSQNDAVGLAIWFKRTAETASKRSQRQRASMGQKVYVHLLKRSAVSRDPPQWPNFDSKIRKGGTSSKAITSVVYYQVITSCLTKKASANQVATKELNDTFQQPTECRYKNSDSRGESSDIDWVVVLIKIVGRWSPRVISVVHEGKLVKLHLRPKRNGGQCK